MEVKEITIKHSLFGEITIHTEIDKEYYELIGQRGDGGGKNGLKYFNGDVSKNEDETFSIRRLNLLQSENFIVGWHHQGSVQSTYVPLFVNKKACDDLVVYPNAILSVVYKENK